MKEILKKYLISSFVTFISVFGLVFFTAIQAADFTFTKQSFIALICAAAVVAVRALAKVIVEAIIEVYKGPTA